MAETTTSFEWLTRKQALAQRWEVEHPDAPDGIAIIGLDTDGTGYLQHYFDSRGVARVYETTFADNVWTLERHAAAGRARATARTGSPTFDLTYTRTQ